MRASESRSSSGNSRADAPDELPTPGAPWKLGADEIRHMIARGHLERRVPDANLAQKMLDEARNDVVGAEVLLGTLPAQALQLGYSGARKAATAILEHQGLRTGPGEGSHAHIGDAIRAQLGPSLGRKFQGLRQVRNDTEYPKPNEAVGSEDDAREAIALANELLRAASKLMSQRGVFR